MPGWICCSSPVAMAPPVTSARRWGVLPCARYPGGVQNPLRGLRGDAGGERPGGGQNDRGAPEPGGCGGDGHRRGGVSRRQVRARHYGQLLVPGICATCRRSSRGQGVRGAGARISPPVWWSRWSRYPLPDGVREHGGWGAGSGKYLCSVWIWWKMAGLSGRISAPPRSDPDRGRRCRLIIT